MLWRANMKLFDKEINENMAIEYLKEYDNKYKNLSKSECPDFISEEDSIGIEVTLVEFDTVIDSFRYRGKKLIEYIRMNAIKPTQKKDIELIENYRINEKDAVNRIINKYYYKNKDNILKIKSIEQYNNLDPNTNLYSKSSFPNEAFIDIDNQIITSFLPSSFWIESIVDKYIQAVEQKNIKLNDYKKFNENSLLIINYSAGLKETLDFEKRITKFDKINFDKIFILNPLFDKYIYEINLGKA